MPAETGLQPVRGTGFLGGFANLLRKELGLWWATKRWFLQTLLWIGLLNGIISAVLYAAKAYPRDNSEPFPLAVQAFFTVGALASSVGAILSAQDSIIGERQSGTAAWILSKPVSRSAYVLSKFMAHAFSLGVLAILIPGILFVFEVKYFVGIVPALWPLVYALGLLFLNVMYYQGMMLMLGTFFQGRGGATGTALGFMFIGEIVPGLAPKLMAIAPWSFGDIANAVALQMPIPRSMIVPIWITALTIPIFLTVALGRFSREEL